MGFHNVYLRNMVMAITIDVKLASSIKVWDYSDCHEKFVPDLQFSVLCLQVRVHPGLLTSISKIQKIKEVLVSLLTDNDDFIVFLRNL